ncbi:MAG: hypothetical protein ACP5RT_00090 [Candidatus Micrarchaeia archaeon]
MISDFAKQIVKKGSIKIRVKRSGMLQQLTFTVKVSNAGNLKYYELSTERVVDTSELLRVASEIGLPVKAPNGEAFPKDTGATDFLIELFG